LVALGNALQGRDVFGTTGKFHDAVFRATGGTEPDHVPAASAAALVLPTRQSRRPGSLDRARVRVALAEMDAMTFFGPIEFRANGVNGSRTLPIIQIL
jgi:branched-chain amino acid transport system substrate-binding protein